MSDIFGASEAAGLEVQTGTETPLSDQERALLQRLLSDPFAYPQQFKTWIISFLEGSDLLLPRSSVQGLSSLLGSGGGQGVLGLLPAGVIFPWGGAGAPVGALLCNGASYSTAGYKRLFDAIGYAFGGSGANFNVPDLRRRIPWGSGAGVPLGASDGKAEDSRSIDHHHYFGQTSDGGGGHSHSVSGNTSTDGSHDHGPPSGFFAVTDAVTNPVASGSGMFRVNNYQARTSPAGSHSHSISGGTSGVGDHSHFVQGDTGGGGELNHPSYLVVGFIINY